MTVVAFLLLGAAPRGGPPSLASVTAQVAGSIRCPVCDGISVEDSSAPIATAMRGQIRSELASGMSPRQIEDGFVQRYGPSILLSPPARGGSLALWVVPVIASLAGVVGLAAFAWKRRATVPHSSVDELGSDTGPEPETVAPPTPRAAERARRSRPHRLLFAALGSLLAGAAVLTITLITSSTSGRLPGESASGSLSLSTAQQVSRALVQAKSLEESGNDAGALALYGQILRRHPEQPEALAYSGWILKLAGDREAGNAHLEQLARSDEQAALAVDPSYPDPHYFLGALLVQNFGDPEGAVSQFQAFLSLHPSPGFLAATAPVIRSAFAAAGQVAPALP